MSSKNEKTGHLSSNAFGSADFFGINVLVHFKDMSQTCPWPQNITSILTGDGMGHFQLSQQILPAWYKKSILSSKVRLLLFIKLMEFNKIKFVP